MRLSSLQLTGFKSFAKKTDLVFDKPITAVVGPNGSGKSNAAEAFRFVLGEQSIKSMRGKKGEDLIFNGGAGLSRQNRAGVALTFDNSDRGLPIDFDSVVIERIVHRDGLNEYLLNGSKVRLRDISDLLAHANIGASGHHIISQGEADRILSASSKERREMIEDALGLRVLQVRIKESLRKLQKTAEHMEQVGSLRKEIAPHLSFLKRQVDKLEKAREFKTELVEKAANYFASEYFHIEREQVRLKEERRAPEKALETAVTDVASLNDRIQALKAEVDAGAEQDSVLKKYTESSRAADEKVKQLVREIDTLQGEVRLLVQLLERAEKHAASQGEKSTVVSIQRKDIEHVLKLIESSVDGLEKNPAALQQHLAMIREALLTIHAAVGDKQDEMMPGRGASENDEYRAQIAAKRVQLESLNRDVTEAMAEAQQAGDALRQREQEIRMRYSTLDGLRQELAVRKQAENAAIAELERITLQSSRIADAKGVYDIDWNEYHSLLGMELVSNFKHMLTSMAEQAQNYSADDQRQLHHQLERLRSRIEDAGGVANDEVMKEYSETSTRDEYLAKELADVEAAKGKIEELIAQMKEELERTFVDGMDKINKTFNDFFILMHGGGSAHLFIEQLSGAERSGADGDDEAMIEEEETEPSVVKEAGIDIKVTLPRKRIQGLAMLSGGERALTSIALLFALSQVNPPPFIILDETDAALDEANSKKYGDMVEALSAHSQLIVITHNRETMSRAARLYGVTMGKDGVSSLLSVTFDDAVVVAK